MRKKRRSSPTSWSRNDFSDALLCGNGIDDNADGSIDELCSCTPDQTQPCFPEGADDSCPGTQTCQGAGEITAWGACEWDPESCDPGTTDDGGDMELCDGPRQTAIEVLTFTSPPQTMGACPWSQGDNLAQASGVMAARHENTQALTPPEGAVLCSTRFEVPETSMYCDDFMYLVFNDIVMLTTGD